MKITTVFENIMELTPSNSRQSFYGKAKVFQDDHHNLWLISYDTIVACIESDKTVHRLWDGWSPTSGTHIASFVYQNTRRSYQDCKKKFWDSLEVEDANKLFERFNKEGGDK